MADFPCKRTIRFCLIACLAASGACGPARSNAPASDDRSWVDYKTGEPLPLEQIQTSSFYLTMRDGVRIAVSLHLPRTLKDGERLPTIVHATRYVRALELYWPFSVRPGQPGGRVRRFVANGYAWLDVDSRGSGASFGTWAAPWAPDEVRDFGEIVDWITRQGWSNGAVGACGVSYDGTAAEMLATNAQPAVKAIVPEFSLFDAYSDIGFPGGIHLSRFTREWSSGNDALDRNAVRELIRNPLAQLAVRGVLPVDGDRDRSTLRAAVASHAWNCNVHEATLRSQFKDDVWSCDPRLTIESFSPHGFIEALRKSGAAIYSYSGWFDGAYQHAAIKRYLTIRNPGSRLVLGPWPHGGGYNSSPDVRSETRFEHTAELLRFFDRHLKGIANGIEAEPPVRYYTMVEGKWKTAETWPPKSDPVSYYFAERGRLVTTAPADDGAFDAYRVDYSSATGRQSRWDTLLGGFPVIYPERSAEDGKLLTYTTAPLEVDTEVSGHPIATLHVASTAGDGDFFAYLEDVGPGGSVNYVTEGELRALHRRKSADPPPYVDVVPYRSYARKDAWPLTPGEVAELEFDLLPTSYLFKTGHSIRIALAGADSDHFAVPPYPPPAVSFYRDRAHASRLLLPVVRRE